MDDTATLFFATPTTMDESLIKGQTDALFLHNQCHYDVSSETTSHDSIDASALLCPTLYRDNTTESFHPPGIDIDSEQTNNDENNVEMQSSTNGPYSIHPCRSERQYLYRYINEKTGEEYWRTRIHKSSKFIETESTIVCIETKHVWDKKNKQFVPVSELCKKCKMRRVRGVYMYGHQFMNRKLCAYCRFRANQHAARHHSIKRLRSILSRTTTTTTTPTRQPSAATVLDTLSNSLTIHQGVNQEFLTLQEVESDLSHEQQDHKTKCNHESQVSQCCMASSNPDETPGQLLSSTMQDEQSKTTHSFVSTKIHVPFVHHPETVVFQEHVKQNVTWHQVMQHLYQNRVFEHCSVIPTESSSAATTVTPIIHQQPNQNNLSVGMEPRENHTYVSSNTLEKSIVYIPPIQYMHGMIKDDKGLSYPACMLVLLAPQSSTQKEQS